MFVPCLSVLPLILNILQHDGSAFLEPLFPLQATLYLIEECFPVCEILGNIYKAAVFPTHPDTVIL